MKRNTFILVFASLIIIISLSSCQKKCIGSCDLNTPKEIQSGIPKFKDYLISHPKDLQTYYSLGMCYYKLLNFNQAILYFDTLISIDSRYFAAYSNRGLCKLFLKDSAGSCHDFAISVNQGQNPKMMGDQTLSEYMVNNCKN